MTVFRTCPIPFGLSTRRVFAGPYDKKPKGMIGVNLSEDTFYPSYIHLPIVDFGVPSPEQEGETFLALLDALLLIAKGKTLYVGCRGGLGRTGLFLSLLVRIMGEQDPVKYVRSNYNSLAVETIYQHNYVTSFDIFPAFILRFRAKSIAYSVDFYNNFIKR